MADYQQNFLASLHGGMDFGQRIKQQRDQSQLNQLAAQSYSTPPDQRDSLLAQMAGVDAGSAFQAEKQMAYSDERRNTNMVNMAKLLTNAPPQARAGLYRSMVPTLSRFGLSEMPQEYNDQTAPIIDKAAQSIVQAYQGANGNTIQSQKISDDGYIINTYRNGRMEKTGQKVDRQMWLRDHPGMAAPELVGKDGSVLQVGQESPSAQAQGGLDVGEGVGRVRMNIEGIDPQRQSRIAQTVSMMQQANYPEAEIEQFIQAQMAQPVTNIGAPRQTFARPSAAQEAAATERAKLQAQQDFLPTELSMRTEADIAKSRGVEQAKSEQERASNERAKTAQLNNVDRGLTRIDEAMKKLTGGLIDTGPIDGRLMVSTPQGQELEAAVGAIQNDMLALTRVPGIGSQSDLEAKIANLKYPSIYNHPSVNAANVQQLKAFMGDLRRQITGSPAQGGRTVVRTGTSNGRKVIQYSDGSVEYGN